MKQRKEKFRVGQKVHFLVSGEGRIVQRDKYYVTIATRGLEMTCWRDELRLQKIPAVWLRRRARSFAWMKARLGS